jgi:hypothetical protein
MAGTERKKVWLVDISAQSIAKTLRDATVGSSINLGQIRRDDD